MTSMSDDPDLARATVVQTAPAKAKRKSRQKPSVAVAQGHASILGAFRRTGATSEAAPQLVRNVLVPAEQAEAAEQVEVPAPQPKKARTTPLQEEIAPQSAAPALPQEDVAPKPAAPVPPLEEVQLVAAPQEEVAPQSAAPAPPLEEVASQSSALAPPLEEEESYASTVSVASFASCWLEMEQEQGEEVQLVAVPAPPLEEVAPQSAAPAPPLPAPPLEEVATPALPQEEVAHQSAASAPPLEEVQLVAVPALPQEEDAHQSATPLTQAIPQATSAPASAASTAKEMTTARASAASTAEVAPQSAASAPPLEEVAPKSATPRFLSQLLRSSGRPGGSIAAVHGALPRMDRVEVGSPDLIF